MNIDYITSYADFNCNTIGAYTLNYMMDAFANFGAISDDGVEYNPLDYMYLLTYRVNTTDPDRALDEFREMNKQLIWNITGGRHFYDYIPVQHAGIVFVDCEGSRNGFSSRMIGLHDHAVLVVHPLLEKRFLFGIEKFESDRVNAIAENKRMERLISNYRDLHVIKIAPTENDVLRAISYSSKAVFYNKGIYHGRDHLFDFIGPNKEIDHSKIKFRSESGKVHQVSRESLTEWDCIFR